MASLADSRGVRGGRFGGFAKREQLQLLIVRRLARSSNMHQRASFIRPFLEGKPSSRIRTTAPGQLPYDTCNDE
jgi:hypothetical protein